MKHYRDVLKIVFLEHSYIKTKPDSLTSQGLPGINTANVVYYHNWNKFFLIKN